jgi:hypothetical protein
MDLRRYSQSSDLECTYLICYEMMIFQKFTVFQIQIQEKKEKADGSLVQILNETEE